MDVSRMAQGLKPSAILTLAGEIRGKMEAGAQIYNLTIGDFDPSIFPIPEVLKQEIAKAYSEDHTNYPVSNGMPELRKAIAAFTRRKQGLDYDVEAFLVSSGARPLIFSAYMAIMDAGDKLIYPAPSWNNNYYGHINHSNPVVVPAGPSQNFMINADDIKAHISGANLLALCSPLNPTGTVFSKEQLSGICELVLEENSKRGEGEKPLYVLYDQIYGNLTHGETVHHDPVSLYPEMKKYTIFIDGISKAFAATGLRLGWGFGPKEVIQKMKAISAHIGSWSGKAEQVATGRFLSNDAWVDEALDRMRQKAYERLEAFYKGFQALKVKGFPVDAIAPQAAIYLTVKIDLSQYKHPETNVPLTPEHTLPFILNEAGLAIVPFEAFGTERMPWYRLSVGTAKMEDIPTLFTRLEKALGKLVRKIEA